VKKNITVTSYIDEHPKNGLPDDVNSPHEMRRTTSLKNIHEIGKKIYIKGKEGE
jgi:hypothetical protein